MNLNNLGYNNFSEFKLVVYYLNNGINPSTQQEVIEQHIDWDLFLLLILRHRVTPLVLKTLSNPDNSAIPAKTINALSQENKKNAYRSAEMAMEMIRITKLLNENDIEPIILKGAPLAYRLYNDIGLRPFGDIDILVKPQEISKAEALLVSAGYNRQIPDYPLKPKQKERYFKKFQHFVYYHSVLGVCVELHWRTYHFQTESLSALSNPACESLELWGYKIKVLADAECFMYLVIHGCHHMWNELRMIYDIAMFMHLRMDWEKILLLANNRELRLMLHITLLMASRLFNVSIPDILFNETLKDKKAEKLTSLLLNNLCDSAHSNQAVKSSNYTNSRMKLQYYISLHPGYKKKLFYFFSYVLTRFQPREEDYQLIPLPKGLNWVYYFIRPFYWAFRHSPLYKKNVSQNKSPKNG